MHAVESAGAWWVLGWILEAVEAFRLSEVEVGVVGLLLVDVEFHGW